MESQELFASPSSSDTPQEDMAALTPEQRKKLYSRQLAEYTLRQWNTVKAGQITETKRDRRPVAASRRSLPKTDEEPEDEESSGSSGSGSKTPTSNTVQPFKGVQVVGSSSVSPKHVDSDTPSETPARNPRVTREAIDD